MRTVRHLRLRFGLIGALTLVALAEAQQPAQLVIANVRVFTGARAVERATIIVADGKIVSIAAEAPVHPGVTIDGAGKTAVPGLIDSHIHVLAGRTEAENRAFITDRLQERLLSFLRHGVTTVKSTGDPTDFILRIRQDLRDGTLAGPRLLVVGPKFTAPGGHPAVGPVCQGTAWCRANLAVEVDSEEQARREVRRLSQAGVDAIKLVYQGGVIAGTTIQKLRPEVMKAIVAEGRAIGIPVPAHVGDESSILEVLAAGVSGLEHGPNEPAASNAIAQALKTPERSLVPTIAAAVRIQVSEQSKLQSVAELYKAGVRIVVGTDTFGRTPPGLATVQEVELLVKAGLSPEAALKAATSVAARYLGLEKEIGTLEAGMSADILVVRGNPLENIADLHQVDAVVQGGKVVFRSSQ
jgi:imidazolonepropionase-like amidohydrolase